MNALQTGAGTFATMWVPSAGVLNTQPSYHSGTLNVIIDDMPSIELLFYAAAQNPSNPNSSNWYQYAYSHSLKMAQNNVRSDGSTYQGTEYNSDGSVYGHFTVNGASVDSTWSRGQAFAIYGFTMAYRYTHDASLLAAAQQTADYWVSHAPADDVPYWDYTQSNYKDSSAAAIAAAGLLELSTFATGTDPSTNVLWSAEYDQAALNIQASLSNPATYLGNTSTTDGTLLHGAYYVPGNLDDDNSLIWGDYYFIQGCYRALAPPPQVTGLTAGTVAYNQVPLSWQAQSGAIRYNVQRGAVSGGPYTVIAPPPVLTANSYTDTTVAPSTTYYYVVSASSVAGEGPNSAELVVTTPATPPDFSLSASPATLSVSQSGSATSTIAVSAVGGFGGPVSLGASSSPAGPVASFNPATVTGSGSAIMTVTANGVPAGTYTLTVTGTSGTLAHATSVTVTVTPGGSFTITANPASLTVSKSTSPTATSTISVASASGFAGTVSLSVGKLPRGVKAGISPNSVSVSPGTPGAATLTLTVVHQASTGIQPITVIGTSSGVPQATVTVQLQVNN